MAHSAAFALLCLCGYAAAASSRDNSFSGFSGSRIPNPSVDSDNDFGDSDDDFGAPKIVAWPDGIVPYVISSDIADADAKKLKAELDFLSKQTCVQFVPRRNEANYTLFRSGDKCSAPLGVSNNPLADSSSGSNFGSSNGGRDSFGGSSGGRGSSFGPSSGSGSRDSGFGTASGSGSRFNSGRFKRQGSRNGVRDSGSFGNSGFGSSSNSGRDSNFGSSSNSGRDSFGSSNNNRDNFGSSFGNSGRGSDSGSRFGSGGSSFRSSGPTGASQVVLAKSCFQTKRLARRLMNLLGIPHEASRPDRDQYVTINFDNIRSGYTANLKQIPASAYLPGVLNVPYDLQSVTQYADSDLAKNKNTWAIRPKNSRSSASSGTLGGDDFSRADFDKINAAYGCRRGGK
ncbi:uncharacterized protein LOC129598564 [Paramacrobiotus metropolitanus]|uniref:uncharacterized protein LOC129598564 n=1 Tax=Paramacrobiotus metropolitanus TaxID=2943436 RepID=UPI0024460A23|nr:uncharacterized protein LOC129598564 [Paramacrobiotus metropolitanus]